MGAVPREAALIKAVRQTVPTVKNVCMGLTPRSRIDMEGIRTIIELREIAGLMKAPVPKPEKYVDEKFYQKALATLTR